MRTAPVAHRGGKHRVFECRVRFTGRLRDARLVPHTDSPPPSSHTPTSHTVPPARPTPLPPAPAPAPAPAAAATPAPPIDFWQTDAGRELAADRERIETVLAQMRDAVAEYRKQEHDRLREWQRSAIELALTIASRLLHDRIKSGEFPIETKVRDMIAQLGEDVPVTIRLNPADLDLLTDRLGGEPLSQGSPDPRFLQDASLGRGDCQVEGRESMLLSDVSRELEEIREELLRSLKNARP
jgi:hypothetical protein